MNLSTIKEKLNQFKRICQERGTQGTGIFVYKSIKAKLTKRINYQKWIAKNNLSRRDIASARQQVSQWHQPRFSVIIPVYNVEAKWLKKAIESVIAQIYPEWEICIADDASTQPHIRDILAKYIEKDSRIKVTFRLENGNISAASNSALELATGDYVALLDHDDELAINALYENAKLINIHPDADFIYSDEDKIDSQGERFDPFFKPDWSPEYFHACMYTCHLGVYRTSLIREIGGFRSQYDGSQDYDLVLRVVEKTQNIYHIPKILYHWRVIPTSTASNVSAKPWAYVAAKSALEAMLERSPYSGIVEETSNPGFFRVRHHIVGNPLVSIIIPSAGKTIDGLNDSLLQNCLRSVQQLSTYPHFEIIVVDGYDIPEAILDAIASPNLSLVRCAKPFNFSARINQGVAQAKGQFLLMLNDDTEVITPDWIESMLELAQQTEIGAVGAKLLFPDWKIQHIGVALLEGEVYHTYHGFEGNIPGYFCANTVNRNCLAVTGACLMIRQEVFQQLGGLDEDFPLNFNDIDLCLRAYQAGYRNVVTPFAQLIHYESASRQQGLKPKEWQHLNDKWSKYLKSLGKDPYYNPNLSNKAANFELF